MLPTLKINVEKNQREDVGSELPSVVASALPTAPFSWKDGRTATLMPASPNVLRGRLIPWGGRTRWKAGPSVGKCQKFSLQNRRNLLSIQQKSGFQ